MNDYISREAAIGFSDRVVERDDSGKNPIVVQFIAYRAFLRELPAADVVEVVHWEWVEDEYGYIHCSQCHMEWDEPEHPETNYCPNCGAKMDKRDG